MENLGHLQFPNVNRRGSDVLSAYDSKMRNSFYTNSNNNSRYGSSSSINRSPPPASLYHEPSLLSPGLQRFSNSLHTVHSGGKLSDAHNPYVSDREPAWQSEEREMITRYCQDRQIEVIVVVEGSDSATGNFSTYSSLWRRLYSLTTSSLCTIIFRRKCPGETLVFNERD